MRRSFLGAILLSIGVGPFGGASDAFGQTQGSEASMRTNPVEERRRIVVHNSCAYPVQVAWCLSPGCSPAHPTITIASGADFEVNTNDPQSAIKLGRACQLKSGPSAVYWDKDTNQCWTRTLESASQRVSVPGQSGCISVRVMDDADTSPDRTAASPAAAPSPGAAGSAPQTTASAEKRRVLPEALNGRWCNQEDASKWNVWRVAGNRIDTKHPASIGSFTFSITGENTFTVNNLFNEYYTLQDNDTLLMRNAFSSRTLKRCE